MMKRNHIFGIFALFFMIFVMALAATNLHPPLVFAQNINAVTARQQVAPTPIVEGDQSEIGSTDGILIMGIVIVVIVIAPLNFYKKRNSNHKKIH